MMEFSERHSIIYQTAQTALSQCDESETFILNFKDSSISFRFCEMISFKRKIQNWDIVPMLAVDAPDVEILHLPHCDRVILLSVQDILELKDLFAGAFTMLELNSLIHRQLIRRPAF